MNKTLWNCCSNFKEPEDFKMYDCIEIQPVALIDGHPGCCEPCDHAYQASFWSVYRQLKTGGVECFTDVSTQKLAESVGEIILQKIKIFNL